MDGGNQSTGRDPLLQVRRPERVNYATGVMLNADDFRDEQTYHRARLARVLSCALGMGTLAGLRVSIHKPVGGEAEIRVEPGAAIDRLGRLVEVATLSCLRIGRWLKGEKAENLNNAFNAAKTAIVADIFLSAHVCERAKTPAFAAGPFDALDAVVPARLEDGFELKPVLRQESDPPLPQNFWPSTPDKMLEAVLGSWPARADALDRLEEHVDGQDANAVFLARVSISATPGAVLNIPPVWTEDGASADNSKRPLIFLPGKWLGDPYTPPPA